VECWLKEKLRNGPVLAKEIEDWAEACTIGEKTLNRAKKKLGVISFHKGYGKDVVWYWKLPGETLAGHVGGENPSTRKLTN
jgi:hypothetical protein